MPATAPIPVFRSRHTPRENLPQPYGAFIAWQKGERVYLVKSIAGRPDSYATIQSDMLWHDRAPEIDSARGLGRWIYEVIVDGETEKFCVGADHITFPPEAVA